MKKVNIILIIVTVLVIVLCAFFGYKAYKYQKLYKEDEVVLQNEQDEEQAKIDAQTQEQAKDEERQKYLEENVYNNTNPIGLYIAQNGNMVRVSEYSCDWSRDSVFNVFYAIASNEDTIQGTDAESIIKENWNKIPDASKYKIGYNIKFGTDSGETINKTILNPIDTQSLFEYLQFYLYDDVTYMPGRLYYHMRQYEVTDKTLFTSVKLVGYKETKGVNGPIELTVFTYDGDEDFDKDTGEYLGNSKFTTKIYREKV